MSEFTFIFLLYNLEENSFGGLTRRIVADLRDQILDTIIPTGVKFILVEHCLKESKPIARKYTNTHIQEILVDASTGKNHLADNPTYDLGARNIGDADSMAGILLLIKTRYPAKKYILFTYNHSNFFGGLYSNISNDPQILIANIKTLNPTLATQILEYTKKINFEFDYIGNYSPPLQNDFLEFIKKNDFTRNPNVDMLTNAEFANAIFKAFSLNQLEGIETGNIEAVFFNSCYTASLDSIYLYSGKVKYIIAAEGEIYNNSFNIKRIVNKFCAYPNNSKKVIFELMRDYKTDFNELNSSLDPDTQLEKMIVSAFEVSENFKKEFIVQFNRVLLKMIFNIENIYHKILDCFIQNKWWDCYYSYNDTEPEDDHKVRNETLTYSIDFFCFFETLLTIQEIKNIKGLKDDIENLLKIVENTFAGPTMVGTKMFKNAFKGLSIFFPARYEQLGEKKKTQISTSYSFYSSRRNEFAKETFWPEFLEVFQKKILSPPS